MVNIRKIDEKRLDKMAREVTVRGTAIRSLQDEKQTVMDRFNKEYQRYRKGQLSSKVLTMRSKGVRARLSTIDKKIRIDIKKIKVSARKADKFVEIYLPERITANSKGIHKISLKRKAAKKKTVKRKAVRKTVKKTVRRVKRKK